MLPCGYSGHYYSTARLAPQESRIQRKITKDEWCGGVEEILEQKRIEKVHEYDRLRDQKRKASGYYDKQKKALKKTEQKTADLSMAANL